MNTNKKVDRFTVLVLDQKNQPVGYFRFKTLAAANAFAEVRVKAGFRTVVEPLDIGAQS